MPDLAPNGQPLMTSTPADEEIGTCVLCESTTEDGRDVELTAHDEARDAFGPLVGTHYVCDDCKESPEGLREEIADLRGKLEAATKALEARKTTAAELEGVRSPLGTSSPDFDAWYLSLERVHPCAEFEGEADQFVVGDLVDAFEAGKILGETISVTPRSLLRAVFDHYETHIEKSMFPLDSPGHAHHKPGTWDKDGAPCDWCATWKAVREYFRGAV